MPVIEGAQIGIERTHYSNGSPASQNGGYGGMNFTGFFVAFPIGER